MAVPGVNDSTSNDTSAIVRETIAAMLQDEVTAEK
jgi:hypothetical protein